VTLAARGLLIEEQRTNLVLQSQTFDNASWTADNLTKSADTATSPDGTVNADSITENTANANHKIYQSIAKAASAIQYAFSVYAKTNGRQIRLTFDSGVNGNRVAVNFDLSTGTISTAASAHGTFTGASASIESVGNGWYRCSLTGTTGTETTVRPNIFLLSGTTDFYTGGGVSGLYLWGAQLEVGAFATSYIPTVAATVTRSADVASVNTLSPWFNATEGTFYGEFSTPAQQNTVGNNMNIVSLSDGTIDNRIRFTTGGGANFEVAVSGVAQASIGSAYVANTTLKFAGAYKANDFAFSSGGGVPSTDTSGSIPTVSQMQLGDFLTNRNMSGHLRRVAYYPVILTAAQLQALTA
jgi:hypothetical protein